MGFRGAIGFDFDVLPHNLLSNKAEILTETIVFVMDFMGIWARLPGRFCGLHTSGPQDTSLPNNLSSPRNSLDLPLD